MAYNKTFYRPKFTAAFTNENGYFSFTGSIDGASGAVGDKIAEIDPAFAPMAQVHLCDAETGEPMHAYKNGEHHFEQGEVAALAECWRVDEKWLSHFLLDTPNALPAARYDAAYAAAREIWQSRADEAFDIAEEIPTYLGDYSYCPDSPVWEDAEPAAAALAKHLDCPIEDVEQSSYDDNIYSAQGGDYLVVDDNTADQLWDESLDNYLDECILTELSGTLASYFDREAWKRDARMDGRGHSLSYYDGTEYDEVSDINGERYYIFRIN